MITTRRDPSIGVMLFEIRTHCSIHTFLSIEDAERFQEPTVIPRNTLAQQPKGKGFKIPEIKWSDQRGRSGN